MPSRRIAPEINVTPLVDIVLVLLIIFMVITPQMESGAQIDLPGIQNPDKSSKGKLEPITVSLTAAGELYLEKDPIGRDALLVRLKELRELDPRRKVVLKADKTARFAEVRKLFGDCRELGFSGVSLQVGDKRKEKKKEPA
ncbi:MAG: biopolymer transporter ExbD [Myxococcales bacterium]|nr:MAG: biopolymer transporter ExbD [Myxococcales bacterium]